MVVTDEQVGDGDVHRAPPDHVPSVPVACAVVGCAAAWRFWLRVRWE